MLEGVGGENKKGVLVAIGATPTCRRVIMVKGKRLKSSGEGARYHGRRAGTKLGLED